MPMLKAIKVGYFVDSRNHEALSGDSNLLGSLSATGLRLGEERIASYGPLTDAGRAYPVTLDGRQTGILYVDRRGGHHLLAEHGTIESVRRELSKADWKSYVEERKRAKAAPAAMAAVA